MPATEIQELLDLMNWSRTDLAYHLHLGEGAVIKWFQKGFAPGGPAEVLMKRWLTEARAERDRQPAGAK